MLGTVATEKIRKKSVYLAVPFKAIMNAEKVFGEAACETYTRKVFRLRTRLDLLTRLDLPTS